jgi:hypothetical protein
MEGIKKGREGGWEGGIKGSDSIVTCNHQPQLKSAFKPFLSS